MNHQNKIIILICEFQRCDKFQLFPTTYKLFLSIHWFRLRHWWLLWVISQAYDYLASRRNFLFLPFEWCYSRMSIITTHRNNDALDFNTTSILLHANKILFSNGVGKIARGNYPTEQLQLFLLMRLEIGKLDFFLLFITTAK